VAQKLIKSNVLRVLFIVSKLRQVFHDNQHILYLGLFRHHRCNLIATSGFAIEPLPLMMQPYASRKALVPLALGAC
jgi:hypothetical protein